MSTTIPEPVAATPVPTPTEAITATVRDDIIATSQSIPEVIAKAKELDPALADQLTAKPLAASKTPWGTLAAGLVSWLSAKYGLGLDEATCALVGGVGVLVGSYIMRWITTGPIAGIFSKGATP